MSLDHGRFHFSVRCHTDDEAVLFCLRALCQYVEQHPKPQIGWGGTGTADWITEGHVITLRFTSEAYRGRFIDEAQRLLSGTVGADRDQRL